MTDSRAANGSSDPLPVAVGVEQALSRAYDHLDRGETAAALGALREALAIDPNCAEANGALADLLCADDPAAAIPAYRAALAGEPGRVPWQRALADALERTGDGAGAMAVCQALLARRPDDAPTRRRLARLLTAAGDISAALEHAWEARFLDGSLSAMADLAPAFLAAGEALALTEILEPLLRRADPDDPALAPGLVALGRAWSALAEGEKARNAWTRALEADPADTAGAGPLIAALDAATAGGEGGELTPAFVRALFDRYADRFEADLVDKLHYTAPQAIRRALEGLGLRPGADLRILDAGCGTGLAGAELRPFAAHLAGIDLAPRMVEKARARGIYDALAAGDLMSAFQAEPAAWDLIVAADVLVYLGDLGPVLAGAATALHPGGRLAFTCERGDADGYRLHEGRRYAHGEGHVRAAAAATGLEVDLLEDVVPRHDRGRPVAGMLVVLRRP
ncbi:MAG: hypothetical protein RLY86_2772 [Pseudomonadota bacterium]|jgi:predicted TPR repeat methyltransferase